MDLDQFFPFRLAMLAEQVSLATAQVYEERFALSRDDWRVLAALGERSEMRTADVLARSTLDKMQVSRALARMERAGLVARSPDPEDGRAYRVRLLPPGAAMYRKIVPMVQAREEYLLCDLTQQERKMLDRVIGKVEARARQLARQG